MNLPRSYLLPPKSAFHFMWRCINGAMFMEDDTFKTMFMNSLIKFLTRGRNQVLMYSFCVMSNHFHMAAELLKDHTYLSFWARSALCSFAQKVNKVLDRRGPVGQGRPKTVTVEDKEGLMRLMFYHDWNPVAAGICDHPMDYHFSSYRFYAFGETNKWTRYLTPPQWYIDLADSPEERQRLYRILCDEYWEDRKQKLKDEDTKQKLADDEANTDDGYGIGSPRFVDNRTRVMRAVGHIDKTGYPRAPSRKKPKDGVRIVPVSRPSPMSRKDLKRMATSLTVPGGSAASPAASPGRPVEAAAQV